MANENVLSGLIRKRAEVAGELEAAQQRVQQLIIGIDNVDATIRIFAPDIDLEEVRPKPLPPRTRRSRARSAAPSWARCATRARR